VIDDTRFTASDPFGGGRAPEPFAEPGDEPSNVTPIGEAKKRRARKPKAKMGERTELELSDAFTARFSDEVRFCGALGGWFVWTGTHWTRDELERVRELVKVIAQELADQAVALMDKNTFKSACRAGSAAGVAAILALARSAPGIVFAPDDANRDPWLLNCASGTVDLRTGTMRPHERGDLITRCAPVDFDASAEAPLFERFLSEVQPDAEVRAYLARLFGCAAVGLVRDHVLAVLWGCGANGKSVLADTVMHVLGTYSKPGPSSLIVANGTHAPHPTDVASCVGSRLVVVHETSRGASFDASKVKLLTGGDRLTARHMREDFFDFTPSHTLVMLSNYRPAADATDSALWRRVHLVAFDVVIAEERRDTGLAEKLRGEAPGVLRWIVEGSLEWQRLGGLRPPEKVREQTEAYRSSEDVIGAFLEERTQRVPGNAQPAGALYAAFAVWCKGQGAHAVRGNDFAAELLGRGYRKDTRNTGAFYVGIGLRSERNDDGRDEE